MDMDIRNEYYEEMAEKVDGIMRRLTDGYRRDGGCFRTADEANPTFFRHAPRRSPRSRGSRIWKRFRRPYLRKGGAK